MGYAPEKSAKLFKLMVSKGYPTEFCEIVANELKTDFTASRMISYIASYPRLPLEEVADEMLAILHERDMISDLRQSEDAQHSISMMYRFGLGNEDEDSDE